MDGDRKGNKGKVKVRLVSQYCPDFGYFSVTFNRNFWLHSDAKIALKRMNKKGDFYLVFMNKIKQKCLWRKTG